MLEEYRLTAATGTLKVLKPIRQQITALFAGKHNTLELCVANGNRDTGIQISRRASTVTNFNDWPSDNLILNCTSFDSFDPATGENALTDLPQNSPAAITTSLTDVLHIITVMTDGLFY